MNPIAVWLSVILHMVVFILSYLELGSINSKKIIKDNGHIVFDFISIGPKSKAPVLSPSNSRASKSKTYTDEKQSNEQSNDMTSKTASDESPAENNNKENNTESAKSKKINDEKKQAENIVKQKHKEKKVTKDNNNEKKQNNSTLKSENKPKNNKSKKKPVAKKNDKALVNLSEKKKKSLGLKEGTKGAFDSLVDNALATGDYENSGINAEEVGDTLTATQIDLIRETIRPCWHFPAGLKDADKLVVDISMEVDKNGYVKSASVTDKNRMKNDSGFRTAAESALRAVMDPACNPLPLPQDKYNEWKNLELSFNPKDWA